ncbi:MAG: DEAD/DEAH box helicase family protein, partial [Acidobacteria bacterium]|nr:DEAD/DEAH box helicase family protein [Acidobacteriota bacterium]
MIDRCPFCRLEEARVFYESPQVIGLWDKFPVSPGHALLIPRRHIPTWFDAAPDERSALTTALDEARVVIERLHSPDGYNIGINVGDAGGQTVGHLHIHLIPRYKGDVADPRGGVRHVIPNYLIEPPRILLKPLVTGGEDPLWPRLRADLDRAIAADIVVAFVLTSGVDLVIEHLRDLLARGGRVRLLTGDYLDVTDPHALIKLLDLSGEVEMRVYEARQTSFHPKAYILHLDDGETIAYVGSSNLSRQALTAGIEWNYRVIPFADRTGIGQIKAAFEQLFRSTSTQAVTDEWIHAYRDRRQARLPLKVDIPAEALEPPPAPHEVQQEALAALRATREAGHAAGLVVLATGLGKTWLCAFDSREPGFDRVLFVAHREEILEQTRRTFRCIRPTARIGKYTGKEKTIEAEVVLASIQTLGRVEHLRRFPADHFDYIVVDEFHHAAARTYRQLLDHFTPKFLLGLTATPERMDGGDLLALCQGNLVYNCDLIDGIRRGLLSPFHYFGVPDEVDYRNIPWRSGRFDEDELTKAAATEKRAQNVFEQHRKCGGKRTLAFCCSQKHADYMADYFGQQGIKAAAVHSGAGSAPRAASLEDLASGDLQAVFAVDMFNEGVDVPAIDTIMMLRPTESPVIWLQQFGRGLRKTEGKDHLTVIDYIGNHRVFLNRPRMLFDLPPGDAAIHDALNRVANYMLELPPGCEVTYELEAIDILRGLLKAPRGGQIDDAVENQYRDFRDRNGVRPTAVEMYRDGYLPRSLKQLHGSWFDFVGSMGDLSSLEKETLEEAREFLRALEATPLEKSFKMVVLLAMLDADAFPGQIGIEQLAAGVKRIAARSETLQQDFGQALNDWAKLRRLLIQNPIKAWVEGKGMGGWSYFDFKEDLLSGGAAFTQLKRDVFQDLVREIVEWRLEEYHHRLRLGASESRIICKVSHSSGRAIIRLPDRNTEAAIPEGWHKVIANGEEYEAHFRKVAVNVLRRHCGGDNELNELLRRWFGPRAGLPGTDFKVVFKPRGEGYELA